MLFALLLFAIVPGDAPIQGVVHRPQYHLIPQGTEAGWISDPNGPIYANGNSACVRIQMLFECRCASPGSSVVLLQHTSLITHLIYLSSLPPHPLHPSPPPALQVDTTCSTKALLQRTCVTNLYRSIHQTLYRGATCPHPTSPTGSSTRWLSNLHPQRPMKAPTYAQRINLLEARGHG